MATLGKVLNPYEPLFAARGFATRTTIERGPAFCASDGRCVAYDRIMGGGLRCLLSLGQPPYIQAESPWWSTGHSETLETAVIASWSFLTTAGFRFLEAPDAISVTNWRVEHNLLVRDRRQSRLVLTWPTSWTLNDVVMASKRGIPHYARFSALELRRILEPLRSIVISDLPYLNALELLPQLQQNGFTTNLTQS